MKRKGKCVGKIKYATRSQALQGARNSYLNRRVKTSIYECPTCLDFHLTSKPRYIYNTEKYFKVWDRQWMHEKYNEFLALERFHFPSVELEKRRAKRKRYKANKAARQANPNILPLQKQKEILATLDGRIYPHPKSFWERLRGIIIGERNRTGLS